MLRRIRYVEDQLSTMSLDTSVNYVSGLNPAGGPSSFPVAYRPIRATLSKYLTNEIIPPLACCQSKFSFGA
jgi:hypothetical protein